MTKVILTLVSLLAAYLPSTHLCRGFAPETDQTFPLDSLETSSITEDETREIIRELDGLYAETFTEHNRTLLFNLQWFDDAFNAYTTLSRGRAVIVMTGGMVRHPLISKDGLALVLCHEIGHHLGGKPKHKNFGFDIFASAEGQADYFATLKCMRKYYLAKEVLPPIEYEVLPVSVQDQCAEKFNDLQDQEICLRSAIASITMANVLNSLREEPLPNLSIENRDTDVVRRTYRKHPNPQCRLDSYYAGALCQVSHTEDIDILKDYTAQCTRKDGDLEETLRPLCWYKP